MTLPPKTFRAERLLLKRHGADLEQITFPATDAANVTSGTQEILDALPAPPSRHMERRQTGNDLEMTEVRNGDPGGTRTRVARMKTWSPRPLDDGASPQGKGHIFPRR